MRGEDDGEACLGDRVHQGLEELTAGERVEARDGLVEEEELGPLREGERERHLRPLAARERADPLAERNAQASQTILGPLSVPAAVQAAAEGEHLPDLEAGIERRVLRDEAHALEDGPVSPRRRAEDLDPAARRCEQADRQVEQSRLAGAVRPHQRRDTPGRQRERAVAERPLVPVALPEPGRLEDRAHAALSSAESRSVVATNATMLSSSRPAACASRSQRTRPPRRRV